MTVLVTGASGVAGRATVLLLRERGYNVKMADASAPPAELRDLGEFVRCDTRTPADCREAVRGCDAIVHLAAWHCAHVPPVSDDTIWAVNTDGTYNIMQAGREFGVKAFVYASSMAYGHGGVYSLTKVVGEEMARGYHYMTGAGVTMLRYHDFVPKSYLAFGEKLLRNGVDARDVASSNVASVEAALRGGLGVFRTIVHTNHGMPADVVANFRDLGPDWCESQLPGARHLIRKYKFDLPSRVEQHDMSEAEEKLGWTPKHNFLEFLRDLQIRDERGDDVSALWAPGLLPTL
ncbi:NAD(P)-dependent oxidoreductase [bacterium]|nr:MAG: NAD(P)-dependent oxidoreductase [bacterium]